MHAMNDAVQFGLSAKIYNSLICVAGRLAIGTACRISPVQPIIPGGFYELCLSYLAKYLEKFLADLAGIHLCLLLWNFHLMTGEQQDSATVSSSQLRSVL